MKFYRRETCVKFRWKILYIVTMTPATDYTQQYSQPLSVRILANCVNIGEQEGNKNLSGSHVLLDFQ